MSKQTWLADSVQRSYLYDYDKANRLKNGIYSGQSAENYSVPKITYDANGNVDSLHRFGETAPSTFSLIDDLKYSYPSYSNKLSAINDNANSTKGFINTTGSTDFTYYADGFQKSDANKGITNIEYNYLGLIDKVHFGGSKRIENTYTADGQKLKTLFISGSDTLKKEYFGDLIYINDTLKSIWQDEGRIILDPKFSYTYWSDTLGNNYVDSSFTFNPQYQYFINDHLGSPRVVFQKLNDSLFIAQRINYGVTGDIISTDASVKNLLNHFLKGKEWIDGFGYNFVTRTYDPYTMRMLQIDGANQFASGYTGLGNSPQMGIDPDGQWVHIVIGAAIGGVANLGFKAFTGQIHSWKDGFAAFGIGAVAGGVGAATGGAAFAAAGGGAAGAGGFLAGAAGGAAGAAVSSPIQGLGNAAYFDDPYSIKSFGRDIAFGALGGGIVNGAIAGFNKTPNGSFRNVWNGNMVADGASRFGLRNSSLLKQQGWTKGVGGMWISTGGGNATSQFPEWVDDLGQVHNGGSYTSQAPQGFIQKDLVFSSRQTLHVGQTAINAGKSYLTENPTRMINDLNKGNFTNYSINHRGMSIVKFNYNIGVSVNAQGINLGNTPFGVVHLNKLGEIHIVPWIPR